MAEEEQEVLSTSDMHCRHCGAPAHGSNLESDYQCQECGQYQDTVACPVCKQPTRASLLDSEHVPAPAKARRK